MEDQEKREQEIVANKQLRKETDEIIQRIKELPTSRERSLAITKLQEGVMWLGADLGRLRDTNPYPDSKDASTGNKIEPIAKELRHVEDQSCECPYCKNIVEKPIVYHCPQCSEDFVKPIKSN